MPRRSMHTYNGCAIHGAAKTFVRMLRFFGLVTGGPGNTSSRVNDVTASRRRSGMADAAIFIAVQWANTYGSPRLDSGEPDSSVREEPVSAEHVPSAMLIACRAVCRYLQQSGLTPRGAAADEEPLLLISSVVAFNQADGLAVAIAELALRAEWQDAHPPRGPVPPPGAAEASAMRRCVDAAKAPIYGTDRPPPSALQPPYDLFDVSGYPKEEYFSGTPTSP